MINNKKLKSAFKLSSKITLYIPATINVNEEVDNTKQVDESAQLFSECFGGSTSTPALGYWMSQKGLVKEKTTIVFAYASDNDLQNNIDKVVDYCEKLKEEMQQEAIALEINGEMYFI